MVLNKWETTEIVTSRSITCYGAEASDSCRPPIRADLLRHTVLLRHSVRLRRNALLRRSVLLRRNFLVHSRVAN